MRLPIRSRLALVLLGSHIFVACVAVSWMYFQGREALYEHERNHALAMAATAASYIDGDAHATIVSRRDEDSTAYLQIRDILRRVRDATASAGSPIRFIYTLRDAKSADGGIEFCVDAEEQPDNRSHVGDVYKYRGMKIEPIRIDQLNADKVFTLDQWGEWLSANAPIRNKAGEVVAALAVDISAEHVRRELANMGLIGMVAAGIAAVVGITLAMLIARWYTRPLVEITKTIEAIERGHLDARSNVCKADEFGTVARAVNAMAAGLQERDTIKTAFARYVSQHVLETILESNELPKLTGERRHITVLFSDIRGFTSLAEELSAEAALVMLNQYFARMIDIVHRHHGMLDKMMGDGIMAIFGAPLEDAHQEEHAIRAAVEMLAALKELREGWQASEFNSLQIGIGIHSGVAVVGNVGSLARMEYTAIGDTVNLASRLESATKEFGEPICLSESTYTALRGVIKTRPLGKFKVRGRKDEVSVYTVDEAQLSTTA